jgi:hypothetical protein
MTSSKAFFLRIGSTFLEENMTKYHKHCIENGFLGGKNGFIGILSITIFMLKN